MAEPTRNLYDKDSPDGKPDPRTVLIAHAGGEEKSASKKGHLHVVQDEPTSAGDEQDLIKESEGADESASKAEEREASHLHVVQDEPEESLYTEPSESQKGRFSGTLQKLGGSKWKRNAVIAGGAGTVLIIMVVVLLGFLNVFKLDGLMSNIEQRAFLRNNSALDRRSSKWISSYIAVRMLELEGGGVNSNGQRDNLYFRANRVDNNNPFTDWYKTMRASKFEEELLRTKGIMFVSVVGADGKIRAGSVDVNKTRIPINISQADFDKFASNQKIDLDTLNKYSGYVEDQVFESNKEARIAIKKTVKENTRFFDVYKRRHLRKSIQNMTGVRDWRFFEKTRDKVDQKKINVRNKVVSSMVPDTNVMGRITRCLFGVDICSPSRDVGDPKNRSIAGRSAVGQPNPEEPKDPKNDVDVVNLKEGEISEALKKILTQANLLTKLLYLPDTLDMLAYVDKNISNLAKLVIVARGAQATGLYQVFTTSRDQIKTGEVTGEEVNEFMQLTAYAGSSAGACVLLSGNCDPLVTQTGETDERCSVVYRAKAEKDPKKYEADYAPNCEDQKIGSVETASNLEAVYDKSIGAIAGPIAGAWNGIKGSILGPFINAVQWVTNKIDFVISKVLQGILEVLGLKDDVKKLVVWLFSKVSTFLGIVILEGKQSESSGLIFNWLVQGGANTAESNARQQGASLTDPASLVYNQGVIAGYQDDQNSQMSFYDKVASLKNEKSLAYNSLFALSSIKDNPGKNIVSVFGSLVHRLGGDITSIFGGNSQAAQDDGYTTSKFAQIETYDYPKKCYDLNALTSSPLDGTNALEIFTRYGIPVSQENLTKLSDWDTISNNNEYYDLIYEIIGERDNPAPDDIAVQIYNCNLLDNAVRGSMGYVYGFTKDYGLEDTQPSSSEIPTPTAPAGSGIVGDIGLSSSSVACAVGTNDIGTVQSLYTGTLKKESGPLMIRLCQIPDLPGQGNNITGNEIGGGAIVNSRVSGAWLALAKAAKAASISLSANSSFRLADSCGGTGTGGRCATPGGSPHQLGVAIDFANMNGIDENVQTCNLRLRDLSSQSWRWMYKNAEKFGFEQYSAESWHWDPIPTANRCNSSEPAGIV